MSLPAHDLSSLPDPRARASRLRRELGFSGSVLVLALLQSVSASYFWSTASPLGKFLLVLQPLLLFAALALLRLSLQTLRAGSRQDSLFGVGGRAWKFTVLRNRDQEINWRDQEIDRLYERLRPLMVRSTREPGLELQIEPLLARLRQLQREEADEARARFELRVGKPGEGRNALAEARRLLSDHEAPASSHPAS